MNLLKNTLVVGTGGTMFSEGLATLVVGLGVVFVALTLLIIILTWMGKFFDQLAQKEKALKASQQVLMTPKPLEPTPVEISEIDDLELVAVITAVIAASMGASEDSFQVRSVKKTNNPWGMSGRTEQLYN